MKISLRVAVKVTPFSFVQKTGTLYPSYTFILKMPVANNNIIKANQVAHEVNLRLAGIVAYFKK